MITFRKTMFFKGGNYLLTAALSAALAFSARAEFTCELSFPQAPSTALANFPVLVRLAENAPTGFSYADCPTANCIWFMDENDDPIPCDVDTWDTTGESLVWVSVPSLSDAATITMHWDVSGAPAGQPASSQVWALADYVGVWHMNELLVDGTGTYTPDSSASGWNAYRPASANYPAPVTTASVVTAHPTPLTGTAMNIANGAGMGDNSYGGFTVPKDQTSSFTLNGPGFTISAIVNAQVNAGNRARVVAFGNGWSDKANLTVGKDWIYTMGSGGNQNKPNPRGATDWVYAAGVYGTKSFIYADGVNLTGSAGGNPSNLSSLTLERGIGLGCLVTAQQTLDGYLDEARIRNAASTADWIAAEYATVAAANYVSFGDVEVGGATVELLRLGTPTVSDITAVSATVAGRLTKLGDGATSASVSLHYTDGGAVTNTVALGSTNAVPAVFTAALANLTPSTAYTVWCSAVNNAETPASTNSVAVVFSTCVDATEWDTSTATFTRDGRTITATVDITNVGSGSSTLYLMTGLSATAVTTVSASVPVISAGTATVTADLSDKNWGTKMYSALMLVNGTAENAITNIYNRGGDLELRDESTYTWVGGSAGVWTNTACWNITKVSNVAPTHPAGYPVVGSTAKFATEEGDGPITVTIPAAQGTSYDANDRFDIATCWFTMYLDLDGMHEPLVFTSEDKTAADCQFRIYRLIAKQTYNRLVFDDCNVYLYEVKNIGASTAGEDGSNASITLNSGAKAKIPTLGIGNCPGFKLAVEGGSTISPFSTMSGGTSKLPLPVMEIDGGTVVCQNQTSKVEPDSYNSYYGMLLRLKGAGASFTCGYFAPKSATSTNVVEFVIPAGGYSAVPVRTTNTGSNTILGETGAKAPMTFRVAKDSPGLSSLPKAGVQLVQSAAGINAANVKFEDVKANYNGFFFKDADGNAYADAAEIEAAGKTSAQITQIWYRSSSRPLCIIVR